MNKRSATRLRMMNVVIATWIWIQIIATIGVKSYELRIPLYNRRLLRVTNRLPVTNLALHHHITVLQKQCVKNVLNKCPLYVYPNLTTSINDVSNIDRKNQIVSPDQFQGSSNSDNDRTAQNTPSTDQPPSRRMIDQRIHSNIITSPLLGKLDGYLSQNTKSKLNMKLGGLPQKQNIVVQTSTKSTNIMLPTISSIENVKDIEVTTAAVDAQSSTIKNLSQDSASEKFSQSLDSFERKFYATTFSKLSSTSALLRRENGMSFVQSGLFLQLALMALSVEVGPETRREIDKCLGLDFYDQERLDIINATVSSLPASSDDLKFRWSSRLVLRSQNVSERFRADAAPALRLQIDSFNGTETPNEMADALNHMVEIDSGGAIHNTFEEEELSSEVRAVLVSTLYLRARWRSAPTLMNGTRAFRDASGLRRAVRMIRINDRMRYARLDHWDAEALEIYYSTTGLSLLMLVPRGTSLRRLAAAAANSSLGDITARMQPLRVAATLPLYTLRMTLLLPNKLQAMNISRLVEPNSGSDSEFRLTLAVQRIMFWAEAGRNAFKDDGLEWDEPPEREITVDRPYIFYVRWKNKTIMNGNFVL